MYACTFFGHRDCPDSIKPALRRTLVDLIEKEQVDLFYVGNQGGFDRMVRGVLRELAEQYPGIRYAVVLAYLPGRSEDSGDFFDTMLPEGAENVHPKYAISWRNQWMLRQSDFVVTYITHSWDGAARFAEKAKRTGKTVRNVAVDYSVSAPQ